MNAFLQQLRSSIPPALVILFQFIALSTQSQVIDVIGTYDYLGVPDYLETNNDVITELFLDDVNKSLPERKPVPTYNPNYLATGHETGVIMAQTGDVFVTFVHEGAGWKNTLGYYTYDTASPPVSASNIDTLHIIYPNSSYLYGGGGLKSGNKVNIGSFPAGTGIGWVLIARGWNRAVTNGIYKVYSEPDFNPETDPNLRQHNVMLKDPNRNLILMGFEDINREWSGCDNDFNDAIFYITSTPSSAIELGDYERVATTAFPCKSVPENLRITEIGKYRANACWSAIPGASIYSFRFRETDGPGPWQSRTVNAPDTCLDLRHAVEWCNSLSPCTEYEWQVSVACTNGIETANSLSHRFTTFCDCYAPTGLATVDVKDDSATINWSLTTGGESYKIRYREKVGPGSWEFRTLGNVSQYQLTGLQPNTVYQWNVSVICEDGLYSENAPSQSFQEFTTTNLQGNRLGSWANEYCFDEQSEITFEPAQNIATLESKEKIVRTADFDGDGMPEMLVAYGDAHGNLSVYLNESEGERTRFASPLEMEAKAGIKYLGVGDLNNDGKPDLYYSDFVTSTINFRLNRSSVGTLAFAPPAEFSTGMAPKGIAAGDVNKDGKVDFIVAHWGTDRVSVFINKSEDGVLDYSYRKSFVTGRTPGDLVACDFDQDGAIDIAVLNPGDQTLTVLQNKCTADTILFHGGEYMLHGVPVSITSGLLNDDSMPDLAVVTGAGMTVEVFQNLGQPGNNMFRAIKEIALSIPASSVTIADVNFDGKQDLVVGHKEDGEVSVYQNLYGSSIRFSEPSSISWNQAPLNTAALSWDQKEATDLVVANRTDHSLGILKNTTQKTILKHPSDVEDVVGNAIDLTIQTTNGNWTYQWQVDLGDGFVDLEDGEEYRNTKTPELTVNRLDMELDQTDFRCLVLQNGCVNKISESARLGVQPTEAEIVEAVVAYPNPTMGDVVLQAHKVFGELQYLNVEVMNSTGSLIMQEQWVVNSDNPRKTISLKKHGNGVYFLKVTKPDGASLLAQQMIVLN